MALVSPFKAVRPQRQFVSQVAAPPYDVMIREEAQKAVAGNALSFLHVEKSEIDVPDGTRSDDELIYRTAKSNFVRMREKGIFIQEKSPCFYIYRQQIGARVQTGIVGLMSAREYDAGKIKKHELTTQNKEKDRTRHVDVVNAQTGPVFITYRYRAKLDEIVNQALAGNLEYNFTADDGVIHKVWVVDNPKQIQDIKNEFLSIDALYIADGHHRAAAAANVARKRRNKDNAAGSINESDMVLAVLFPHDQLKVMDYNRAVKDLNGLTPGKYLEKITSRFTVNKNFAAKSPQQMHDFGMYLGGEWYQLIAKKGIYNKSDPVASLDASILQEQLLAPVLGIKDPRTDDRIKFIGGIRGMAELEKLVDKDGFTVAFSLYPTTVEQIMKVSDAGAIMPPKSTWFEPKIRSGIFIHDLS
jgi:uncharacterized protein (DUF1015 family)